MLIKVPEVVVIDEEGNHLGTMTTQEAIRKAREDDLDLIEVSPLANPPVCRIMNIGKWQYLQSQKTKKQKTLETKIIRLSFKIAEHDRNVRAQQALKFLTKGHKVRLEMRLRGRERAYPQQAKDLMKKFIDDLDQNIAHEQRITIQGPMISTLISKKA